MEHGKHLVMMNVEADVTIGAYLKREADRLGVVYSLGAGDEPAPRMELIEFVRGLGYPIVSAGKGKNNRSTSTPRPTTIARRRSGGNMNPRMLVEFVDGSKTMVEMVAIANATGLVPDVPGMHGPAATATSLLKVLIPREGWRRAVAEGRRRLTRSARAWRPASSSSSRARIRASSSAWTICKWARALLHLLPALSSDLARSAADLRPRRALRQGRHGAAAGARRPKSAPSPSAISPPARRSMRSAKTAIAPGS